MNPYQFNQFRSHFRETTKNQIKNLNKNVHNTAANDKCISKIGLTCNLVFKKIREQ